jgi:dihydroxyacetone kinase-like protein
VADVFDGATALAWLRACAAVIEREHHRLTELDAAIGDGDHGENLSRGFTAVVAGLDDTASPGQLLTTAGTTLISVVGGASGPLFGSALRAAGRSMNGAEVDADALGAALAAGLEAIHRLGGAVVGDKTIVDALSPAVDAYRAALARGGRLSAATAAAADAADEGALATVPLVAHKGRASYLGERAAGHQDPGATSTALLLRALADVTA